MTRWRIGSITATWIATSLACLIVFRQGVVAEEPPEKLKSIGGKWYVAEGGTGLYYYNDSNRFLELFSYHMLDSNKDGIPNLRIRHDQEFLVIESQGYPNHKTAIFPNSGNPNSIRVQEFVFKLPLVPHKADRITRLPMGPIGTALNGVVFFNPFEQGGMNAVEGYSEVWLDSCCGHPQQEGVYHYHKYPSCVKSPFPDDGQQHSPLLGFAFDGFPIYGPYESAEVMAKDLKDESALDVCNGHSDSERGYHYHVTPGRFPYIIGGYAGEPEISNSRGLRRPRTGAIEDNTQQGENSVQSGIVSVSPGTLKRGETHTLQIQLHAEGTRPPLPGENATWIQFGPWEGKNIRRSQNTLSLELTVPQDAPVGLLFDCHIEFDNDDRRGPRVYKKNDAIRVSP